MADRQASYEAAYFKRMEQDRPKPKMELDALLNLARDAVKDPSRLIEWSLASTPEEVIGAVEAERWDRNHPYYTCIECKDGSLLPEGYVCKVCGADNPTRGF